MTGAKTKIANKSNGQMLNPQELQIYPFAKLNPFHLSTKEPTRLMSTIGASLPKAIKRHSFIKYMARL